MKYYIVADIHGFYDELIDALTEKGFFDDASPHKLIICGDIFDRGKKCIELQNFIVQLIVKNRIILIRGNHEDLLDRFISDGCGLSTSMESTWIQNGTISTVMQLTGLSCSEICIQPHKMKELMMNTPYYSSIRPLLLNYFETENYIFVHGWIPAYRDKYPGGMYKYHYIKNWRESNDVEWCKARWYNGMDAAHQGVLENSKTIICGHWHCSYGHSIIEGRGKEYGDNADYSPYYGKGIIGIDACTALTHRINCLIIED